MSEGIFIKKHWMMGELMKHPKALAMLIYIKLGELETEAFGLKKGEVKITADIFNMNQADYRLAKKRLEDWKLVKFSTTNKFSIGKITNQDLFVNE